MLKAHLYFENQNNLKNGHRYGEGVSPCIIFADINTILGTVSGKLSVASTQTPLNKTIA